MMPFYAILLKMGLWLHTQTDNMWDVPSSFWQMGGACADRWAFFNGCIERHAFGCTPDPYEGGTP
jgi:hypothetical protein